MDFVCAHYDSKPPAYFANARDAEAAPVLGKSRERAFALGCGDRSTLVRLKPQAWLRWTAGIEINTAAAASAQDRPDRVIDGNIESVSEAIRAEGPAPPP